jgi:hypothetical protein
MKWTEQLGLGVRCQTAFKNAMRFGLKIGGAESHSEAVREVHACDFPPEKSWPDNGFSTITKNTSLLVVLC